MADDGVSASVATEHGDAGDGDFPQLRVAGGVVECDGVEGAGFTLKAGHGLRGSGRSDELHGVSCCNQIVML